MYKKLLLLSFSAVLFVGFGSANVDINSIRGEVCSSGTLIQVAPGGESELCLKFSNDGDTSLGVQYKFLGAYSTEIGAPVCGSHEPFSAFFPDKSERSFVLSGHSSKEVREKIIAPLGSKGLNYGCIQYGSSTPSIDAVAGGGMFAIDVVRAMFVKIFVGGKADIKKSLVFVNGKGNVFSTDKKVVASYSSSGLDIASTVSNNGNVVQSVALTLKVSNFLGFERIFSPVTVQIDPGQSYTLHELVDRIPGYKGFFDAELTVVATPKFEFDVSSLGGDVMDPTTLIAKSTFFLFSWIWLIPVLIIVLILLKVIFLRRKKESTAAI